jgi:hypothetical protein
MHSVLNCWEMFYLVNIVTLNILCVYICSKQTLHRLYY